MTTEELSSARLQVPGHVAIIPDGNRRWAAAQGKSVYEGHQAGAETFRQIARQAADRGVKHVSFWGMSQHNFSKRSALEVTGLLRIFRAEFERMLSDPEIHERQVRVRVIGRWREKFPLPVRRAIENVVEATKGYQKSFLNFFLVYNGTDEMIAAIQKIVKEAQFDSEFQVTPALLKQHLWTAALPPVDLLIRTAGEPHLSAGFMMWDVADSQLFFTDTLWPAFTAGEFDTALAAYSERARRFGV